MTHMSEAKAALMARFEVDEKTAHRVIQRLSMNLRIRRADAEALILNGIKLSEGGEKSEGS